MKILRSLNKYFFFIIIFVFCFNLKAEEKPIDIWNIDQKKKIDEVSNNNLSNSSLEDNSQSTSEVSIYDMQIGKENNLIKLEENLSEENKEIFGLYDPEDNGLKIDMWTNSDGDQLKTIISKINKLDLSDDASEIMRISLLTNSHFPKKIYRKKNF